MSCGVIFNSNRDRDAVVLFGLDHHFEGEEILPNVTVADERQSVAQPLDEDVVDFIVDKQSLGDGDLIVFDVLLGTP